MRGRPPRAQPMRKISAWIPEELSLRLGLLLLDPVRNRTQYGALSALVTRLLEEWEEGRRKAAQP